MRISTTWFHQLGVNEMLQRQSKLSESQLKLSTGQKYLKPSENPQAATALIDFNQRIKVYEQYQDNIVTVRQRLEQAASGIDTGVNILQRVRELTVQGLNDTNSGANRRQIAEEIDQLNGVLHSIANTQNPNGEFIFSGFASDRPAFSAAPGFAYNGDGNQRGITIGPNRTVADGDPGQAVFGVVALPPTAPGSIDNVFQALQRLADDFRSNVANPQSLADIDRALDRFTSVSVSLGARLNAIDAQQTLNEGYIIEHKAIASQIGDLDYAEAISQFNLQEIALQAAQQSFARIQNLSLFNFLR
ncbi:MAG: flagellar hook-associated protein FlgL [Methylomonas sp.]|nr:flagellar hook-associated protein FlgL [Methylomonas sp.]PPD19985.1 MAG: flagellar hook-associated protein 3 [Methylomonas sp.]PPD26513.1 MAG: flagellar hook-associated protein 3 [Methylomonas sp.]PPD36949.1 MAG: flagellar hook-associated protein 3 [Methylomonas sp.]PPD38281.1 MAG: flagellar hook-associated protein 3 [Methylomonas sp.]